MSSVSSSSSKHDRVAQDAPTVVLVTSSRTAYQVYPQRWIFLATLFSLIASSSILWITFGSIMNISVEYFQVSFTSVSYLSLVFYAAYVVFSLPASAVFQHYGVKVGVGIGAILSFSGAWLRYGVAVAPGMASQTRFAVTVVAQVLAAVGQPFLLNATTKFSAQWFPWQQRGLAITVASVASPIGFAMGAILVPALCNSVETLSQALLATAIVPTVASLPLLFLPSKPHTPPGPIAAAEKGISFFQGVKIAFASPGFIVLLIGFATMVGTSTACGALMTAIIGPYGYTNIQAGYIGLSSIVGGMFGAAVLATVIDRTGRHIQLLRIMLPVTAVCFIGMYFVMRYAGFVAFLVINCFIGAATFGLLPVSLELGVECTHPAPEGTSTGLLWMASQFFALLAQLIMTLLRAGPDAPNPNSMDHSLMFAGAVTLVAAALGSLCFRGTMRRRESEQLIFASEKEVVC